MPANYQGPWLPLDPAIAPKLALTLFLLFLYLFFTPTLYPFSHRKDFNEVPVELARDETKEPGPSANCEDLLIQAGFPSLIELLDKEREMDFLKKATEFGLQHANDQSRSRPFLLEPYQVELSSVPAKFLPVVCAKISEGYIRPTPLGEIVKTLYSNMQRREIEGFVILTSGGAKEAVNLKPPQKSKLDRNGELISMEDYLVKYGPPKLDGDLTIVINKKEIEENHLREFMFISQEASPIEAIVINSRIRTFSRIDVGRFAATNQLSENYWYSWGHFTFPEYEGNYDSQIPFIKQALGNEANHPCILIIPTDTPEGFIGVNIKFFPRLDLSESLSFQQRGPNKEPQRSLRISLIPWFPVMFPIHASLSEAHVHHLHLLRNCTWENTIPLIIPPSEQFYWQIFYGNTKDISQESVQELSRRTSIKLAEEIIYPIVTQLSKMEPTKIKPATKRLYEAIKPILNGDPFLGIIYLLSAGENPTQAPVYGMGFIDKKGFFPELYDFLHEGNRLNKLLDIMEKCPYGKAEMGWMTFVHFIYNEAGKSKERLFELLRPSFCSPEIFSEHAKTFILKAPEPFRRLRPTDKPGVFTPY